MRSSRVSVFKNTLDEFSNVKTDIANYNSQLEAYNYQYERLQIAITLLNNMKLNNTNLPERSATDIAALEKKIGELHVSSHKKIVPAVATGYLIDNKLLSLAIVNYTEQRKKIWFFKWQSANTKKFINEINTHMKKFPTLKINHTLINNYMDTEKQKNDNRRLHRIITELATKKLADLKKSLSTAKPIDDLAKETKLQHDLCDDINKFIETISCTQLPRSHSNSGLAMTNSAGRLQNNTGMWASTNPMPRNDCTAAPVELERQALTP